MDNKPRKQLVTTADVQKQFSVYSEQIKVLEKSLVNAQVTSLQDCDIVMEQLTKAKDLVKTMETFGKDMKMPHSEAINIINSYLTKFMGSLVSAVSVASNIVLNYKTLESNNAREQAEAELKKISEEQKESEELLEKIARITQSVRARLFGGIGYAKGNETVYPGIKNLDDCVSLRDMLEVSFPPLSMFKGFAPTIAMVKEIALNALNTIEQDFRKGFTPDFQLLSLVFDEKALAEIKSEQKRLVKTNLNMVKEVNTAAASVMKGTRKNVKFQVTDITKIPANYLMVNERAVNDYISTKRLDIKKKLDQSPNDKAIELIGGIKFYYEKKVVG